MGAGELNDCATRLGAAQTNRENGFISVCTHLPETIIIIESVISVMTQVNGFAKKKMKFFPNLIVILCNIVEWGLFITVYFVF